MKTFLLKIKDDSKAAALALFLKEIDFVEELRPVSHWRDEDFDAEEMETEVKANMLRIKNPAIAKHLLHED